MDTSLQTFQLAEFALTADYSRLEKNTVDQLKRHLLDSLGSLFESLGKPSVRKMAHQLEAMGTGGNCKVPVLGSLSADRAAQWYTALIRYPDFMDNYLGKESTCHPCDNIGSLIACSELRKLTGRDFLTAMAVSYQVQCRLIEEIPVMTEGIDHTLLLSFSITAGISRLLKLSKEQTAHALAISGSMISPLVTSRASYTYEWKGFVSSLVAQNCVNIAFLAQQGMTGPIALFEGAKGFQDIFKMKLDYDWSKESFELIPKCILKRYNAEVHSQSAIDAAILLKREHKFQADEIEKVEVTTFLTAYHIIGSGEYGDRQKVYSKEQADHSLFYVIAVALLDGEVYPAQFEPERINRDDVQDLLQKVHVHTKFPLHKPVKIAGLLDGYTEAYPDKMKAKVEISLKDGRKLHMEKEDYPGFHTRPFTWKETIEKFAHLSGNHLEYSRKTAVIDCVKDLENQQMDTLVKLLTAS
jgi:2-methylcitrate dehydratase